MKRNIFLAFGITLLFLGVGIQPAIATVEPEQPVNDDCDCEEKSSFWGFPVICTFLFGLAVLCVYYLAIFGQLPYLFEVIGEISWMLDCFWLMEPPMERLLSLLLL